MILNFTQGGGAYVNCVDAPETLMMKHQNLSDIFH